jgi:hypothetical protein
MGKAGRLNGPMSEKPGAALGKSQIAKAASEAKDKSAKPHMGVDALRRRITQTASATAAMTKRAKAATVAAMNSQFEMFSWVALAFGYEANRATP